MSTVKFSVKLLPINMEFVNSSRLIFPQIFRTQKKFLEVIYNAVMKYLNFRSSGSKLESVTCKITENRTSSQ